MATFYWVGGAGTWNNSSNTNWASSSGGAGGAGIPSLGDVVYFDSNSGGAPFVVTLAATAVIPQVYVLTANVTLRQASDAVINGRLTLEAGTYDANNYNVSIYELNISTSSGARSLLMGSGLWTVTYNWFITDTTNLTVNTGTANILWNSVETNPQFDGATYAYNKLTIGPTATSNQTFFLSGNCSFTELASQKTNAFDLFFGLLSVSNISVGAWSITGTAGNVVRLVTQYGITLTKTSSGPITGVDYLFIGGGLVGLPAETWYVGENSTFSSAKPNTNQGFINTKRQNRAVIVLTSTSAATWTVPSDWNNNNNEIHLIGGGGGGAAGDGLPSSSGGGGGGGGGYTKLTSQTLIPGSSISYQAGTGGAAGTSTTTRNGTAGATTSWNSGAATAPGGGAGLSNGTGGSGGVGVTYTGGSGGAGGVITNPSGSNPYGGGGGGGGAAGPYGNGGNGGAGVSNAPSTASLDFGGGGGGGHGGGTSGAVGTNTGGGVGGKNYLNTGNGLATAQAGTQGGGGAGYTFFSNPGLSTMVGGAGMELYGAGSGGGSGGRTGGSSISGQNTTGGRYGGGGGGSSGGSIRAISGAQGVIIITYVPTIGNFLAFF